MVQVVARLIEQKDIGISASTPSRYSLRFSPPESLPMGAYCISGVKRNRYTRSRVIFPSVVVMYSAISFT